MARFDPTRDYDSDAACVFDCLKGGGIAIVHMDVAYAVMSGTEEALRNVYAAKRRSFDKASGIVANHRTHDEIHLLPDEKKEIISTITDKHDLPISVIAPFRTSHPLIKELTPFLFNIATRNGTVNFLLNASPLREKIAAHSLEHNFPLIASSANVSQRGTKYTADTIEAEVLSAADIIIDYGPASYMDQGNEADFPLSSTQIDFQNMRIVRRGICFDRIEECLRNEYGITLAE
jgi:tRNA A37 threonylcarbamoyladenosine synthetase subunit TsaC/SUA5/YrdC